MTKTNIAPARSRVRTARRLVLMAAGLIRLAAAPPAWGQTDVTPAPVAADVTPAPVVAEPPAAEVVPQPEAPSELPVPVSPAPPAAEAPEAASPVEAPAPAVEEPAPAPAVETRPPAPSFTTTPAPVLVPAPPAGSVTAVARPAPAPVPIPGPSLNWFGFGVRFGSRTLRLDATSLRQSVSQNGKIAGVDVGKAAASQISDLSETLTAITPSFHLGGDGYFWLMEFPYASNDRLQSYGFGMSPINYGYFIQSLRLFPYFSAGGALHLLKPKPQAGAPMDKESAGLLVDARVSLGLKWRVLGPISVGIEAGHNPWATGILLKKNQSADITRGMSPATIQGGKGKGFDVAVTLDVL